MDVIWDGAKIKEFHYSAFGSMHLGHVGVEAGGVGDQSMDSPRIDFGSDAVANVTSIANRL